LSTPAANPTSLFIKSTPTLIYIANLNIPNSKIMLVVPLAVATLSDPADFEIIQTPPSPTRL